MRSKRTQAAKGSHPVRIEPRSSSNSSAQGALKTRGLKKRVLIIDDDEAVLCVISKLLVSLGFDPKTVCRGIDGIQLLQNEMFDLVIVDMIMPEIGGLVLIEVIRQEHPTIPILAISGYCDKLASVLNGAKIDAILPKPITLDTLKTTLNRIFSAKPPSSSHLPEFSPTL